MRDEKFEVEDLHYESQKLYSMRAAIDDARVYGPNSSEQYDDADALFSGLLFDHTEKLKSLMDRMFGKNIKLEGEKDQ